MAKEIRRGFDWKKVKTLNGHEDPAGFSVGPQKQNKKTVFRSRDRLLLPAFRSSFGWEGILREASKQSLTPLGLLVYCNRAICRPLVLVRSHEAANAPFCEHPTQAASSGAVFAFCQTKSVFSLPLMAEIKITAATFITSQR